MIRANRALPTNQQVQIIKYPDEVLNNALDDQIRVQTSKTLEKT